MQQLNQIKAMVDTKAVFNTALGVAAAGTVFYLLSRSGVKPLKDAAKVAKGGK